VLSAERLAATFSTDRRHMRRDDGSWLHPPPAWAPPAAVAGEHNLERFYDVDDDFEGEWLDLSQMLARFG
jgi:hypothetical protein